MKFMSTISIGGYPMAGVAAQHEPQWQCATAGRLMAARFAAPSTRPLTVDAPPINLRPSALMQRRT
ncbi:MAG: hypothetical protein ACRDRN_08685 [Sciscionella sp.]